MKQNSSDFDRDYFRQLQTRLQQFRKMENWDTIPDFSTEKQPTQKHFVKKALRNIDAMLQNNSKYYKSVRPFLRMHVRRSNEFTDIEQGTIYQPDSNRKTVVFMAPSIVEYDAIGTDIREMVRLLSKDYSCWAYAQTCKIEELRYVTKSDIKRILFDPNAIVIYNHSMYWREGELLLEDAQAKIVIRYHNITSPDFFAKYNDEYEFDCAQGRKQTQRIIKKFPHVEWISASAFNTLDLFEVTPSRQFICPPFHKLRLDDDRFDADLLNELNKSRAINLLFVGRISPNKGHCFLLEIVYLLQSRYGLDIKLRLIGKQDSKLQSYTNYLKQVIDKLELKNVVEFLEDVSDEKLRSYYRGSDFFLCCSEHEGFCVPLLEAQCSDLPIIARYKTAVPDTLGKCQILLSEDVTDYAATIKYLYDHPRDASFLSRKGKENFMNHFTYSEIAEKFVTIIKEIIN